MTTGTTPTTSGRVELVSPDGLVKSPAFSHVAVVSGPVRTIYVGGQDAVGSASVPGMRIIEPSEKKRMDAELRNRIQAAITPEKKPGFFSRFFHREEEGEGTGA